MPLYEYKCSKCSHCFEFLTTTDGKVPKKCPSCGASDPVKQFSAFAVSSHGGSPCEGGAEGSDCRSCSSGGSCPYSGDWDD